MHAVESLLAAHPWARSKGESPTPYDRQIRGDFKRLALRYRLYRQRIEERRIEDEVQRTHDILRIVSDQVGVEFVYVDVPRLGSDEADGDALTLAEQEQRRVHRMADVDEALRTQNVDRSWSVGSNRKKKGFFS